MDHLHKFAWSIAYQFQFFTSTLCLSFFFLSFFLTSECAINLSGKIFLFKVGKSKSTFINFANFENEKNLHFIWYFSVSKFLLYFLQIQIWQDNKINFRWNKTKTSKSCFYREDLNTALVQYFGVRMKRRKNAIVAIIENSQMAVVSSTKF